jgi:hypothetical protein
MWDDWYIDPQTGESYFISGGHDFNVTAFRDDSLEQTGFGFLSDWYNRPHSDGKRPDIRDFYPAKGAGSTIRDATYTHIQTPDEVVQEWWEIFLKREKEKLEEFTNIFDATFLENLNFIFHSFIKIIDKKIQFDDSGEFWSSYSKDQLLDLIDKAQRMINDLYAFQDKYGDDPDAKKIIKYLRMAIMRWTLAGRGKK